MSEATVIPRIAKARTYVLGGITLMDAQTMPAEKPTNARTASVRRMAYRYHVRPFTTTLSRPEGLMPRVGAGGGRGERGVRSEIRSLSESLKFRRLWNR